ncbi:MAG: hypothetical protein KGH64_04315 [Candidatus Micrarchaeota archaeon]|nr:hypothetical protein [Candidatus Micrarchaeota archaeon]
MAQKYMWGVAIGTPKSSIHTIVDEVGYRYLLGFCGKFKMNETITAPLLFQTRDEARAAAKQYTAKNKHWRYHAAKFIPGVSVLQWNIQ